MAPQPPQAPQPASTPIPVIAAARPAVLAVIAAALALATATLVAAALTHQPWLVPAAPGIPAIVGMYLLPHLSGVRPRAGSPSSAQTDPPEA